MDFGGDRFSELGPLLSEITASTAMLRTWACFEALVPLVHISGIVLTLPPRKRHRDSRLTPLLKQSLVWGLIGGKRTFICQVISWVLFTCSLLVAVPMLGVGLTTTIPSSVPLDLLVTSAAFSSAISLLFMFKSILLFDPTEPSKKKRLNRFWTRVQEGGSVLAWDVSRLPSPTVAFWVIVGLGLLWTALGFSLLLTARYLHGQGQVVYAAFAVACFTIAAFSTHGIGGHFMHRRRWAAVHGSLSKTSPGEEVQPGGPSSWHFFQPFKGGSAFVATQAMGWILYSSAIALVLWSAMETLLGAAAYSIAIWPLAAGTSAALAEVVLVASLLTYKAGQLPEWPRLDQAKDTMIRGLVISILYIQIHAFIAVFLLTFAFLPTMHATSMWAGGLFIYYCLTGFTGAEHTGRRRWPGFQTWLGSHTERVLPLWLGSLDIIVEQGAQFDPGNRYVFSYVPHGLYPLGAAYLPLLPTFQRLIGIRPTTLVASVCFVIPVIRDILAWSGLRSVRRRTFVKALREEGAVLVVPGGQAELVEAHRMHHKKHFTVFTRHKGFVRIALQERAALVPIVVMGEVDSLRNLVTVPCLHRWSYKKLGFPFPFIMIGRRGVLPFPSQTGLKFIVGKPIEPPANLDGPPTEEQVMEAHTKFYEAVERLWHKHKNPIYTDAHFVKV